MDMSSQMITFARVVEKGSISAASRDSGQTPSAVSKQISHLEDHVGQRLLRRSRAGVSLTPAGIAFFPRCRALAEKFAEAEAFISTAQAVPKGRLNVASSVAFGKVQLIPALPDFLDRHPEVGLSLTLTDRQVDIEAEGFDVAIAFAEQLTGPDTVVRRIMRNERILCAAPAYLEAHGRPETFADLARFNCLRTIDSGQRNEWQATIDGEALRVDASGNFSGNSADAVLIATLAGMGIARLSRYMVADKIASGALVHLFPDYAQDHADIAVTFADRRNLSTTIRVFVDFLVDRFR